MLLSMPAPCTGLRWRTLAPLFFLILIATGLSAAEKPAAKNPPAPVPATPQQKQAAVQKALSWEGQRLKTFPAGNKVFRGDCSGFVQACYQAAGYALLEGPQPRTEGGGCALIASRFQARSHLERTRIPAPGDLLFFDNTWDANGNGKRDDRLTHVALVVSVKGSQVTALHMSSGQVKRLHLDLAHPDQFMNGKTVVNDPLRKTAPGSTVQRSDLASRLLSSSVGI